MIKKAVQCKRGQALVETTFAFLLFILMFFSIVEFSHLLYAKLTLQHTLRETGRFMVTGRTSADKQGNDIPRSEAILNVFCGNLTATGLKCPDIGPQFSMSCVNGPCTEPGGGPEQMVFLNATFNKQPLFPFFRQFFSTQGLTLQLSTTWKNEPFQR